MLPLFAASLAASVDAACSCVNLMFKLLLLLLLLTRLLLCVDGKLEQEVG
jgi:hypothetical protein